MFKPDDEDRLSTIAPSEISQDLESKDEGVEKLVAAENRRVRASKLSMFGILGIAALSCSYATFAVFRNNEEQEFRAKVS